MKINSEKISIDNITDIVMPDSIQKAIILMVERLKKLSDDLDIVVVDLKNDIIDIPVVKVIVTDGLQTQR